MILLEIETQSISGIEFEGDTPRTIDADRVAGNKTPQGMKIKPRFICSGAVAGSESEIIKQREGRPPAQFAGVAIDPQFLSRNAPAS